MEREELKNAEYRSFLCTVIYNNTIKPHCWLLASRTLGRPNDEDWQKFWEDTILTINNQFNEENND